MLTDNKVISDTRAYWQLTTAVAIWGFSWLCGRVVAAEGIPAIPAAAGRFILGSLGLAVVMALDRPWPRPSGGTVIRLLAMGFFGVFLYNLCFFNGLRTVPAGRASLMASLQPAVVFLFSAVVWNEPVTRMRVVGLVISFCGALLVLSQGDPAKLFESGLNTGDLWILGCVLSWVVYTLLGRTMAGRIPAGPTTAYSTWAGTALVLLFMAVEGTGANPAEWSPRALAAIAFLGICGTTVAFLLFLHGLGQIGASRASIFINLVPVFGVLSGTLVLGERLSAATLAGGALVLAGVRLLNR